MRAARQRRSENTANRVCVYIGVGVYVERRARERDGEMARAPGHVPGSPWQPVRERELSLSGSALVREAALFFLLYLYAPREREFHSRFLPSPILLLLRSSFLPYRRLSSPSSPAARIKRGNSENPG